MSKDAEKTIHSCLEMKGNGDCCVECAIPQKGPCPIMIDEIVMIKNKLNLPIDDLRDVISESIKAVLLSTFRGSGDAEFRKWVRRIIENKKNDYLRKKYKKKEHEVTAEDEMQMENMLNQPDMTQEEFICVENKCDVESLLKYLEEKVSSGELERSDLDLVQACYDGFKEGLTRQEIAIQMNLKPNTFNQKILRLRNKLTGD